jgi:hypothetical protein
MADNLMRMASWRRPGRAERVVIELEGGGRRQYWRAEDADGAVSWRENAVPASAEPSGDALTTAELLKVIEGSLTERRRAARGRKFRL